jgi:hypothetical protein
MSSSLEENGYDYRSVDRLFIKCCEENEKEDDLTRDSYNIAGEAIGDIMLKSKVAPIWQQLSYGEKWDIIEAIYYGVFQAVKVYDALEPSHYSAISEIDKPTSFAEATSGMKQWFARNGTGN